MFEDAGSRHKTGVFTMKDLERGGKVMRIGKGVWGGFLLRWMTSSLGAVMLGGWDGIGGTMRVDELIECGMIYMGDASAMDGRRRRTPRLLYLTQIRYWEPTFEDSLSLIVQLPAVATYVYHIIYKNGEIVLADNSLDYGANFSHMLRFDSTSMSAKFMDYTTDNMFFYPLPIGQKRLGQLAKWKIADEVVFVRYLPVEEQPK
ncbi:citrate synthase, mitochondrial [Tanacetum coccineum]